MAKRETHLTRKVFVAGATPTITYNPRDERHLEQELNSYLDQGPGRALSVSGPTKSGKTVLVERRLPRDEAIWMEGPDLQDLDTFWNRIVDWLGLYDLVEVTVQGTEAAGKEVGLKLGPKVATFDTRKSDETTTTRGVRHSRVQALTSVARSGLEALSVPIVIDDFHYVADVAKKPIARAIKTTLPLCNVVLIAVPHEAFEVVRNEPDMGYRLQRLQIEPWSLEELEFIAARGFEALGIDDQVGVGRKLAENSFGAPFLMQDLCYHHAVGLLGVLQTAENPVQAVEPPSWRDFFGRIANRTPPAIFEDLLRGPKTRGQKRIARVFKTGKKTDIYGALLYAIAEASRPTVSYETLARVLERDLEEPITGQQITSSLGHMAAVANLNRGTGDAAIAYKNDELHVLDPFLLFYLTYGNWSVEKAVEGDLVQEVLPNGKARG